MKKQKKESMTFIHSYKVCWQYQESGKLSCSLPRGKSTLLLLFVSKIEEIAKYIEPSYVRAFHLFETDRGNYEFAIEISLQPEYFIFLGEFHEIALIASLFIAMLNEMKLMKVLDSWVEMCEDDGKTGVVI